MSGTLQSASAADWRQNSNEMTANSQTRRCLNPDYARAFHDRGATPARKEDAAGAQQDNSVLPSQAGTKTMAYRALEGSGPVT